MQQPRATQSRIAAGRWVSDALARAYTHISCPAWSVVRFVQQKFNLMHEESEGFAKLLVELNQPPAVGGSADALLHRIESAIGAAACAAALPFARRRTERRTGTFDLDPNRVIDIMLTAFESHPDRASHYVALLRAYVRRPASLVNILGFRFQQFGRIDAAGSTASMDEGEVLTAASYAPDSTPETLYRIAALLIKAGLVSLDGLWPHVSRRWQVRCAFGRSPDPTTRTRFSARPGRQGDRGTVASAACRCAQARSEGRHGAWLSVHGAAIAGHCSACDTRGPMGDRRHGRNRPPAPR